MKKAGVILIIEMSISAVIAFLANNNIINYDFFTVFGLGNLIIGLLGAIAGLIGLAINKETGQSLLIASGLLLLAGCLTCAVFPFRLNMS